MLLLEQTIKQHGEDIEAQGGTLDHVVKTLDTIVIPTQDSHSRDIIECRQWGRASHDYITEQKGAWAFIQRAVLILGAGAALLNLGMKLWGKG